ncbi:ABC transporter ATP-binding protein [Lachnospiraceae bacterium MD1]|jgi:putative ABC transport system ATP-binding protein|uniref:ABC transporter ATP-binding protein n=1 Tax=Variimorphobacter saccharofermentans TaxID=2755051 RepID=A0A839K1R8_9FIRM|nr:ABC transporter ATP-binding protein [Variimorphobacter saccharofermentans]MBB2182929.1 ABC transporter ATP-binding protein [Variimorphobacter saccharofermentans]
MKTTLEVQNLCKSYEDSNVLNDINLKVNEGEFLAIMGQSGSGKSTLLYSISGMDRPTSGKVMLYGKDISEVDDDKMSSIRLNKMGFVFQHSYLLKNLSIRDNIVLPGFKARTKSREEINRNADRLLAKTGIEGVANHDIKKVSGGQLQRAAICRALINQPDILFCDEPTGALNSSTSKEVMDIINTVNSEGTTVIMVTHSAKVASRADRVIFLMDGKIHDELILGKYNGEERRTSERVQKLSEWLEKQGF